MGFEERLQRAIQRGHQKGEAQQRAARQQALSEEELKRLHNQYRLELSEQIEQRVGQLAQQLPGFQYETIFGDRGWGAACWRDALRLEGGKRSSDYSRLEMTVRPYAVSQVIELTAKGTIRNRELFSRTYFEKLTDIELGKFSELIDRWVLEYAELYAAKN